jgi:ribonuclease R
MIGRSSGKAYRLGDRLRVRVSNVSLDERRVDFELAGATDTPGRPRRPRQSGRRR